MRVALERARNLPDAARRVSLRSLGYWIVIDDRFQHDRVVGVEPERDLILTRTPGSVGAGNRGDVPVEAGAIASERPVIHEPVAHVQVERLVEQPGGVVLCRDS